MAEETNVTEFKKSAKTVYHFKLKDMSGVVVFNLQASEPLQFPYLFWKGRLFVTERDNPNTLLERSYIHLSVGGQ